MRLTTLIITLALFSPFCLAESGVDIGADASKDQKTSVSSKISREKSMSISQDQKSSRRRGSEKANENRRETSRSKSRRIGTDRSTKNDTSYSLSVVNLLLSTVAELENSEGNFKNCHLLSNSFTQKFPIAVPIGVGDNVEVSWVTNAGGIASPTLARWLVNDLTPGFDQLQSYLSCWLWYGEILTASLDDLVKEAEKGVYRNEKHVKHDAIVILKRNARSRDIMNSVLQQTAGIEACSLPTGKGIENESEIRVLCGSIEIRPHEGVVMNYGTPLFNADSIKGRKLDIAITASDSTHEGIELAQDYRDSSSESSRRFSSAEQSTENGRSLSYRKSEGADESISSDDDIRANETFKASPQ